MNKILSIMSVCCCQLFPSLAIKHKEDVETTEYYLIEALDCPAQIINNSPRPYEVNPLKSMNDM